MSNAGGASPGAGSSPDATPTAADGTPPSSQEDAGASVSSGAPSAPVSSSPSSAPPSSGGAADTVSAKILAKVTYDLSLSKQSFADTNPVTSLSNVAKTIF